MAPCCHRRTGPRASSPAGRPTPGRVRRIALALLALLWPAANAPTVFAVERVHRLFDERDGLAVAEIPELAQDARGFLWIGTIGGLTRFDGGEMRAWAPDSVRHAIEVLAASPDGQVLAAGIDEPLWRVTADGVEPIPGPDGRPVAGWAHATLSQDGAVWVARGDSLLRRDREGRWSARTIADFGGQRPRRLSPAGGDSVFAATRDALWVAGAHGAPRRLADIPFVRLVVRDHAGRPIVLSEVPGRVWRLGPEGPELLYAGRGGGKGLAVRGATIWAQVDSEVLALHADGRVDTLAPRPGLPNGRPLLVDREGTLWIGGFRGLIALPEPGTVAWNELDGLPTPAHAHHLCRTPDGIWVITWFGTVFVETTPGAPRRIVPRGSYSGRIRPDPAGRLWASDIDRGFIRWDGRRPTRFPRPNLHGVYGTAPRPDGRLWLATDDGLFLAPVGDGAPTLVAAPAPWPGGWEESWVGPVLEDALGRLWLGHGESVWSCDAESLAAGRAVSWREEFLPGSAALVELLELEDGTLWLATNNRGLVERRAGVWRPLAGNRHFDSLRIYGMAPSPSGGVWVLGAGIVARVRPDAAHPDGFVIVERLTAWQGLPTQQASDIHEDDDGRLWLATLAGLVEVPPEARRYEPIAPAVMLVEVEVDGERVSLDRPLELPWERNRIELRFATLSYRDRTRLRYQARTMGSGDWMDIREPMFRFVDLPPGDHRAELRASLDGGPWTDPPARLEFRVAAPWWERWWARSAALLLVAALLFGAYRLRIGVLRRLERQRLRIAMDLHDEVGSGLGSIGILAGLAADERLPEERRRELAARISETATELGAALGDIVRSLHHGVDTAEAFANRLAGRARRLVPGPVPRLQVFLPAAWPEARFDAGEQRQVQAIVTEALHNAVRHAGARTIALTVAVDGGGWYFRVDDDGRGPGAEGASEGHGLRNMQERARTLGATLRWGAGPDGGTRVELALPDEGGRRSHHHAKAKRSGD
jgi:signal transduction histidine kinase/ligand-binding sensor domain-containing protein